MTPAPPPDLQSNNAVVAVVQRQLDAYNARDLARFVACYADDVRVWRPPATQPALVGRQALADHYAAHRFNLPALHAELLARIVIGRKVIDQERITGVSDAPIEAAAVYQVNDDGLISAVWFFNAD
jgi:hypothetical protein